MLSNDRPHELKDKSTLFKGDGKHEQLTSTGRQNLEAIFTNEFIPNPGLMMKAAEFHGKEKIELAERPAPTITQADDCIVRVTAATICGSDLHFYWDAVPGPKLDKGYILGHEAVGYVHEVGPDVKNIKVGDRVVIPFPISCGECFHCKEKRSTLCDRSNPLPDSEALNGHRLGGLMGYGWLTGGYAGTQAEYVRIMRGDVNLLKVPESVKDSQILGLSDILCTAWHGLECGEVKATDKVVIWGAGPVGLAALYLAKTLRNVETVVVIDYDEYRLSLAQKYGAIIINRSGDTPGVIKKLHEMFPNGQDVSIDCTGEYSECSFASKMLAKLIPHDPSEVIEEMAFTTRKFGNISLIRAYFAITKYPIGVIMEKHINVRGGQAWVHKYWQYLLDRIVAGDIEPSWIFSHVVPFEQISEAYKKFALHEDKAIKYLLQTAYGREKQPVAHTMIGAKDA